MGRGDINGPSEFESSVEVNSKSNKIDEYHKSAGNRSDAVVDVSKEQIWVKYQSRFTTGPVPYSQQKDRHTGTHARNHSNTCNLWKVGGIEREVIQSRKCFRQVVECS